MSGIPATWVNGNDFVMVHPEMVRAMGGNVVAAMVAGRLHYRLRGPDSYDRDGRRWLRLSQDEMAYDLGVTRNQVRAAMTALAEAGYVASAKHRLRGASDHTLSYRLIYTESAPAPTRLVESTDRLVAEHQSRVVAEHQSSSKKEEPSPARERESATSPPSVMKGVPRSYTVLSKAESRAVDEGRLVLPAMDDTGGWFDLFWSAYPLKQREKASKAAFVRAARALGRPDVIWRAAKAYRSYMRDEPERYLVSATSWLAESRWTDNYRNGQPVTQEELMWTREA